MTWNMCKKCSYGCCKEKTNDVLNTLWNDICDSKYDDILLFGNEAMIPMNELEKFFERAKSNNNNFGE